MGLIADKYHKFNYGLLGCVLILVSLAIPFDIAALVLMCIGNALAHIGGAQKTLRTSGEKIAPSGVFVGGGSFGVITGQLLGALGKGSLVIIPAALIAVAALILLYIAKMRDAEEKKWTLDITKNHSLGMVVFVAFVIIAIRAYIGYAIPTEWKKTEFQAVLLFVSMGMGKALGGFIADKYGFYKTAIISSVLSLPFLLFGNSIMTLSLIGVGLFSMTMPITIAILVSKFPDQPCFSFGITTVALFTGILPVFFIRPESLIAHQITVLVLITIATIALLYCLEKRKNHESDS